MDYGFWLSLIAVISLIIGAVAWFTFLFASVWRIERRIQAAGEPRPCMWDGIGLRVMWYAWAIAFSTESFSQLERWMLDPELVEPCLRSTDKILAWIIIVSVYLLLVCNIIEWIFGVV